MGCNSSTIAAEPSTILLVGIGGVGKSTVFKQMKLLFHPAGVTSEERIAAKFALHTSMLQTLANGIEYGYNNKLLVGQ